MGGKWPKGHCATVMNGQCKYCKIKSITIIPWVDFNWPKDLRTTTIAKMNRD